MSYDYDQAQTEYTPPLLKRCRRLQITDSPRAWDTRCTGPDITQVDTIITSQCKLLFSTTPKNRHRLVEYPLLIVNIPSPSNHAFYCRLHMSSDQNDDECNPITPLGRARSSTCIAMLRACHTAPHMANPIHAPPAPQAASCGRCCNRHYISSPSPPRSRRGDNVTTVEKPPTLNAFTTGNPLVGWKLLGISIGKGFGVVKAD